MTEKMKEELTSNDSRQYKIKIGSAIASSLSGFLAGLIVASIIFLSIFEITLK